MIKYAEYIKKNLSFQSFLKDCKGNTTSHAYMVVSDDFETLASCLMLMCQGLLCSANSACGDCGVCERIENHNHANVNVLGNGNDTIKVEDVLNMINSTFLTPFEIGKKVYLVFVAEKMNESAQNKLLKTLEEPQNGVVIILGVLNETMMLNTIKSRCKKLYLNIWSDDSLQTELKKRNYSSDETILASNFAAGSIQRATEILSDTRFLEKYNTISEMLLNLNNSAQLSEFYGIMGKDKQEFENCLTIIEGIIGQLMKEHIGNSKSELAKKFNINTLANVYYKLIDSRKKINANCSFLSVESDLLLGILEINYLTKN